MIPPLFHSRPRHLRRHWTSGWSSQLVLLFRVQEVQFQISDRSATILTEASLPQSLQANAATCVISGFHRGIYKILTLPGCYASQTGSRLTTFRDNLYGYHLQWSGRPSSLKCLTLEDGTHKLVRNVGD